MSNLQKVIEQEANNFARAVVHALRGASLDELVGLTSGARAAAPAKTKSSGGGGGGAAKSAPKAAPAAKAKKNAGGRVRRTSDDIKKLTDSIVTFIAKNPGLRAEQIRGELKLSKQDIAKPIIDALGDGRLRKKGQKRATTYFAK